MADSNFVPSNVRDDLKRFEKALKRLAVGYEMFLNQTVRWPPHERRAEVDAIVRHYTKNPPRQTSDRFRFNNLLHRYRTNLERWKRRMRQLEESGEARLGPPRTGRDNKQRQVEDADTPYTLMSVRVTSDAQNTDQMRDLYLAYRRARRARGKAVSQLGYGSFSKAMRKHIASARSKGGDGDVELRVDTLGGNVRIAVRTVASKGSSTGDEAQAD